MEKFGTQLVQKIYELRGYWTAKTEDKKYHSNRVLKSVKAKKAKKGERKQLVIERYWQKSEITKDMSPHRIAKILRKDLEKSMSTDSIKRYLKEEGLVL